MPNPDARLATLLQEFGYISEADIETARRESARMGETLRGHLLRVGRISELRLARALEEAAGIPLVYLSRVKPDAVALGMVPASMAQELRAIPFFRNEGVLRVAFENPLDSSVVQMIERQTGLHVERYSALANEIDWGLAEFYPGLELQPPAGYLSGPIVRLGDLAVSHGFLSETELQEVLDEQAQVSRLLGQLLIDRGYITDSQLGMLLGEQYQLPFEPELHRESAPASLADTMMHIDAAAYHAVPYRETNHGVVFAIANPLVMDTISELSRKPASFVISTPTEIAARIDRIYGKEQGRIGETLIRRQLLKPEQLRMALSEQLHGGGVRPLGEVLVRLGFVTEEQVQDALQEQRSSKPNATGLGEPGKADSSGIARSLALQLGYEYVDSDVEADPYAVSLLPEQTAIRYSAVPLRIENNRLVVAMKDPRQIFAIDDIRLITKLDIRPVVATANVIDRLVHRYYHDSTEIEALTKAVMEEVGADHGQTEVDTAVDDNALVRIVNSIIRDAAIEDASDIHVEPKPDRVLIRLRKDGVLRDYMTMPRSTAAALLSRIKIMGGLNIAERRVPQDGRVRFRDRTLQIDLRLSTLPTVYGEKAVMRLLKRASDIPEIEGLGFRKANFDRFVEIIEQPYGIFLITGPTGSGKSFTSMSILKRLATPEVNVLTVEDPVEYEIPGISQTQVNPRAGLTFANALRSILRQDPDIIMVGEIRDEETARISLESALTGHLVVATLHTNDAASAITRLGEMGIETFNTSASLLGVLAQRLLRRICTECKTPVATDPVLLKRLGLNEAAVEGQQFYTGRGCDACHGTGYDGRVAVHELLTIDGPLRRAIVRDVSAFELKELAIERGMKTLREDALAKALDGITTLEEVLARTGE